MSRTSPKSVEDPSYDGCVDDAFLFSEKTIRHGFIRKVYGILFCQLLVTFGIVCIFSFVKGANDLVRNHIEVFYIAIGVSIFCLIAMVCCDGVRRKAPMNFIFLSIFTLAEGFLLGCFCISFDQDSVLIAIGITIIVVFALTVFAFQTKWDFTTCGGILLCLLLVLTLFGICLAIFGTNKASTIGYASFGALLFSVYIVYDTQLMMGGQHKYSISPEEYIFAALNLYLDVINLFMYILLLVSGGSRN